MQDSFGFENLKSFLEGVNCLLQMFCAVLLFPDAGKHSPQIVMGPGPVKRCRLAAEFF